MIFERAHPLAWDAGTRKGMGTGLSVDILTSTSLLVPQHVSTGDLLFQTLGAVERISKASEKELCGVSVAERLGI